MPLSSDLAGVSEARVGIQGWGDRAGITPPQAGSNLSFFLGGALGIAGVFPCFGSQPPRGIHVVLFYFRGRENIRWRRSGVVAGDSQRDKSP